MKTSKNTIETLVATATKMGFNSKDAQIVIEKSFDYIMRMYPTSSAKKLVSIAYNLY